MEGKWQTVENIFNVNDWKGFKSFSERPLKLKKVKNTPKKPGKGYEKVSLKRHKNANAQKYLRIPLLNIFKIIFLITVVTLIEKTHFIFYFKKELKKRKRNNWICSLYCLLKKYLLFLIPSVVLAI